MSALLGPRVAKNPRSSLALLFTLWKTLLFIIAFLSPGPGYDTSTTLIKPSISGTVRPFVRWDAIYFTQTAQRGYLFEQEWAFSWTLTRIVAYLATYLRRLGVTPADAEPWTGIIVSNVSHLVSIILLYELSLRMFSKQTNTRKLAFVAACLHIISPAGLFLSAPYAESTFSMLQFLAYLLYTESQDAEAHKSYLKRDFMLVGSGAVAGLATAVRSNGIFTGLIFAYDAIRTGLELLSGHDTVPKSRKLLMIIMAGSLVGLSMILPQAVAYKEYCAMPSITPRPWCDALPPSIYTFVQSHYWNVGFLRYWTISNAPLFLLAAPMLLLLTLSSLWGIQFASQSVAIGDKKQSLMVLFAVPQALIVLITLTTSHVQIVTRLASGYPLWYWWLASLMVVNDTTPKKEWIKSETVVRWMVIYAIIQGGLYASFLPPA